MAKEIDVGRPNTLADTAALSTWLLVELGIVAVETTPQQYIAAEPRRTSGDVSAHHLKKHSYAAGANVGTAPLGADMKHPGSGRKRSPSFSGGSNNPATQDVSPSFLSQPSSHPESWPPGVDRLGCSGAAMSPPSSAGFIVPPHAHYEATGFGWECNVGYVQNGDACVALHVPVHAHLDISGHGWFCNDGFVPNGEECMR